MRSLALLCLLIPTLSWETDVWTTPYAGVRRLDRTLTNPNFKIHALEVDLTAPGVSLTATSTAGGRGNSAARAGRRSWARLYRGPWFVGSPAVGSRWAATCAPARLTDLSPGC